MGEIVLYDYWRSSAAYRVRIALNLKGMTYRAVPVNLLTGEHKGAANLARNKQALVPTLTLNGLTLTQSLSIIEYLDETHPDPRLIPQDSLARHRARAIAAAIAMEIHPVCNMSVARYATQKSGDEMGDWMRHFIPLGLAGVEAMVSDGQAGAFCQGDAPGLADCCLIPQLYNARRWEVDLTPYPTLTAIEARCAALPAFQRAHPDAVGAP